MPSPGSERDRRPPNVQPGRALRDLLVIALIGGGLLILASALDLYSLVLHWAVRHEGLTLEEGAGLAAVMVIGFGVFAWRRWRELAVEIAVRARVEEALRQNVLQLEEALAQIKTLTGLLPICAWCKKIRNDEGYWVQIESYVRANSDADFTHAVCPECSGKLKSEMRG